MTARPTTRIDLLNVGFGNVVRADRVVAIVTPASAPMRRLREEARLAGKLVDATAGRRTRSIVITDSDHIVLSAIQAETMALRLHQADRWTPGGARAAAEHAAEELASLEGGDASAVPGAGA